MKEFFTDLHIHIGRAGNGAPVKITAAKDLTFANICSEAAGRKGIEIIGIVDCASPAVIADIKEMLANGTLVEMAEGGMCYQGRTTIILGAEIEISAGAGSAHGLCYFPRLEQVELFSQIMTKYIKNVGLSSQRARLDLQGLWEIVDQLGGVLVPAHAFTPHKGLYGNCTDTMAKVLTSQAVEAIPAVELGLSADTELADLISDLAEKTFLTNSDAHSLPKIGREYNLIKMMEPNFTELLKALRRQQDRRVVKNFGLTPLLGKYHRTYCHQCDQPVTQQPPVDYCPRCQGTDTTLGVLDRIYQVKDLDYATHPAHRPEYHYQVPLQFLPKVGAKTIQKLIDHFGSEMTVIHHAELEQIARIVGPEVARLIHLSRTGQLAVDVGGGGHYGKVLG